MELAKIRNKARQEAAGGGQLEEPKPVGAVEVRPEVVPLEQPLPEDLFQPVSPRIFPETLLPRPAALPHKFDPLAVIMAGRSADLDGGRLREETLDQEPQSAAVDAEYEEFLCFRLGNEEYGINIMEIKEIIKPRELTEVPRMPSFVDGVLSLRGVIVPVFAMRKRLAMPLEYERSQERIVIVRCGEGLHGLRVDRVTDVLRIFAEQREATPAVLEGVSREFVAGIGRSGGRMIILLDIAKVVDTALDEGV